MAESFFPGDEAMESGALIAAARGLAPVSVDCSGPLGGDVRVHSRKAPSLVRRQGARVNRCVNEIRWRPLF